MSNSVEIDGDDSDQKGGLPQYFDQDEPQSSVPAVQAESREQLGPDDLEWMVLTAFIYLQNHHYDKAISLLEAALSFNSSHFDALKQLAYAYLATGRHRETVIICEKIYDYTVEQTVQIAPVYLMHSYALLHMDQKEQARDWLLKYQSFLGPDTHV